MQDGDDDLYHGETAASCTNATCEYHCEEECCGRVAAWIRNFFLTCLLLLYVLVRMVPYTGPARQRRSWFWY